MLYKTGVATMLLLLPLCSISAMSYTNPPSQMTQIEKTLGGYQINTNDYEQLIHALEDFKDTEVKITEHEEKVLWENKEKTELYDVSKITGKLIEIEVKTSSNTILTSDFSNTKTTSSGFYLRWYKVEAKNAWGWTMFWLCARGLFIFSGKSAIVLPSSFGGVEWWCNWAWSRDYLSQRPTASTNWGRVDAECGFTHILGQRVNLWAYVKCYSSGTATGDGGAL